MARNDARIQAALADVRMVAAKLKAHKNATVSQQAKSIFHHAAGEMSPLVAWFNELPSGDATRATVGTLLGELGRLAARRESIADDGAESDLLTALIDKLDGAAAEPMAGDDVKPVWDSQRGVLTIDGQEAKKIRNRKQAKRHIAILDAFENDGWPARIDTPFSYDTDQQFHQAILSLNDGLQGIKFRADGSGGEGITWERSKDGQRTVN